MKNYLLAVLKNRPSLIFSLAGNDGTTSEGGTALRSGETNLGSTKNAFRIDLRRSQYKASNRPKNEMRPNAAA